MAKDVVLVFELTTDLHWMKEVVQIPIVLAKQTGGVAHAIVRPNHKQSEVAKHIKLHYLDKEIDDNYYCFETADFCKVITSPIWYLRACKEASKIGEILILYPFFGKPLSGAFIFKLKRWLNLKKAFVLIKSDGQFNHWTNNKASYKKKFIDYIKYFFIDQIIFENESIYSTLKINKHHLFSKIVYIPLCPLDIYHSQVITPFDNRPNNFIFVGRISDKEKGADILLEAWMEVSKRLPDWKLQMVGPCSENFKSNWAVRLSAKQSLDSVIWASSVSPVDLLKYYNNSKIVVCSSRKESGPIVLSEAALSGCAFIGTAVGEIPNILAGLPGLVRNTKYLAETMIWFANNPSEAIQQAKELYRRTKHRKWDEQVKK